MAISASGWFTQGKKNLLNGTCDFTTHTLYVIGIDANAAAELTLATSSTCADITGGSTGSRVPHGPTSVGVDLATTPGTIKPSTDPLTIADEKTPHSANGPTVALLYYLEVSAADASRYLMFVEYPPYSVTPDDTDDSIDFNASGIATL